MIRPVITLLQARAGGISVRISINPGQKAGFAAGLMYYFLYFREKKYISLYFY